ncbi:hypothetical protein N7462_001044 [Penicillium macrosclerotiorum]|uniref:uncharacterized protein n=1 Tax=Penicillium macrosclerotiorum TaxID=303699 RepID=UPI0025483E6D|nr:uncharacterized protein N7462_001044 [Penicillium macrosclerotiorum]KAJ5699039.1 hypothetical protein N7462_001044 [Penicillium macrosclerotiorum]
MPPLPSHHPHRRTDSQSSTYPRASILPSQSQAPASFGTTSHASAGSTSMSAAKTRQYAHLHAQLAQLNANLADTENLLRMTAVQAGDMRFLGGYIGAMFMGSAKILGEEGVKGNAEELEKDGKSGGRGGC